MSSYTSAQSQEIKLISFRNSQLVLALISEKGKDSLGIIQKSVKRVVLAPEQGAMSSNPVNKLLQ